jgi:hypothetical protein
MGRAEVAHRFNSLFDLGCPSGVRDHSPSSAISLTTVRNRWALAVWLGRSYNIPRATLPLFALD